MDNERVERIRVRAHAIWEEEGRPEGREDVHWQRAVSEIGSEDAGSLATAGASDRKPRRRRAAGLPAKEQVQVLDPAKAPLMAPQPTKAKSTELGGVPEVKATLGRGKAPAAARESGVDPVRRPDRKASSPATGSAALASRTARAEPREGRVDLAPRGSDEGSKAASGDPRTGASPKGKKGMRAAGTARRMLEGLKPATTRSQRRKPS